MKPDRWQKIEQVFHAALQRKPEERASFLQQTCAGDEALYSDVKSLLTSYGNDDSFFEDSASALAAEMFGDMVGETIGPYEVLSELGSGGMGTVYLAHDARLGRKIALKLLPPQFTNDKDRLRRFQQEARAASALNHPNILTCRWRRLYGLPQSSQRNIDPEGGQRNHWRLRAVSRYDHRSTGSIDRSCCGRGSSRRAESLLPSARRNVGPTAGRC